MNKSEPDRELLSLVVGIWKEIAHILIVAGKLLLSVCALYCFATLLRLAEDYENQTIQYLFVAFDVTIFYAFYSEIWRTNGKVNLFFEVFAAFLNAVVEKAKSK